MDNRGKLFLGFLILAPVALVSVFLSVDGPLVGVPELGATGTYSHEQCPTVRLQGDRANFGSLEARIRISDAKTGYDVELLDGIALTRAGGSCEFKPGRQPLVLPIIDGERALYVWDEDGELVKFRKN